MTKINKPHGISKNGLDSSAQPGFFGRINAYVRQLALKITRLTSIIFNFIYSKLRGFGAEKPATDLRSGDRNIIINRTPPKTESFGDIYKKTDIIDKNDIENSIKEIRKKYFDEDKYKHKSILPFFRDISPRELLSQTESSFFTRKRIENMLSQAANVQKEVEQATKRETEAHSEFMGVFDSYIEVAENLSCSLLEANREKLSLSAKESCLITYLENLSLSEDYFDDKTEIYFENGTIKPLEKTAHGTEERRNLIKNSLNQFFHILESTYGPVLINTVIKPRYALDNITHLTMRDIKRVLIGVAANVRSEDLRELFQLIKSHNKRNEDLPIMKAGNYILKNTQLLENLRNKDKFDDLSSKEIGALLEVFRTVPTKKGSRRTYILEALDMEDKAEKPFLEKHDIELLELIGRWEYLSLYHHELAITEYLGKSLPYKELKKGMVIPCPNKDNEAAYYQVESVLPSKNDGVRCFLIASLNKHQNAYSNYNTENINLVFRGTEPHAIGLESGASVARDLEAPGIGKSTFLRREPEIVSMVEDYLLKTEADNVTLNIAGHSLGGCDTQRALTALLEKIADADPLSPYSKVKKIIATSHNSPGIDLETAKRYFAALDKIDQKKADLKIKINHVRYRDLNYEDIVQKAGDVLIGAKLWFGKDYPFVEREANVITFDIEVGFFTGLLLRHGTRVFNKTKYKEPWIVDTYSDKDDNLDKILAKNWFWDANEAKWNHIAWYASYASKYLQIAGQSAFAYLFNAGLSVARIGQSSDLRRTI